MKMILIALVTLTVLGAGVIAAPSAEDGSCTQPSIPICPIGEIPWWNGHHGCGGEMWSCVAIIDI